MPARPLTTGSRVGTKREGMVVGKADKRARAPFERALHAFLAGVLAVSMTPVIAFGGEADASPEVAQEAPAAEKETVAAEAAYASNEAATKAINNIKTQQYYRPGNNCPRRKGVGWLPGNWTDCRNGCYVLVKGFSQKLLGGTFISGVTAYGYKATNAGSYNCVGTLVDTPKAQPSLQSVKNLLLKACPGDVIQFKGGPSSYGGTAQHTALVEAVDGGGIRVYQHGNSAHINSTYYNWTTFYNSYLQFNKYTNYNKGISLYHHKNYSSKFPNAHGHSYRQVSCAFIDYSNHRRDFACSCNAKTSKTERHVWKTTTDDKQRVCQACGHEAVGYNGAVTTIPNGIYLIEFAKNNKYRLDISGALVDKEGTNVALFSKNPSIAQQVNFKKSPYKDGTYIMQTVGTNNPKLIGAAEDFNQNNGVNICLRKNSVSNESNRWFIEKNSNGTYSFRNKCTNMYLDVRSGVAANGTNIQLWPGNRGDAQHFNLIPPENTQKPTQPSQPTEPEDPKPSVPVEPDDPEQDDSDWWEPEQDDPDASTPSKPAASPKPSQAASWHKTNGTWWYQRTNGTFPINQWERIGGAWYHFDRYGLMQTGWLSKGGRWYYLGASGVMKTGWFRAGSTWYRANSSGIMQTGWLRDGGKWYYLGSDGAMRTGWYKVGKKWYYSNASGVMQAGKWVGNYYLTKSGAMATNTWIGKYHVNSSGKWDKTR